MRLRGPYTLEVTRWCKLKVQEIRCEQQVSRSWCKSDYDICEYVTNEHEWCRGDLFVTPVQVIPLCMVPSPLQVSQSFLCCSNNYRLQISYIYHCIHWIQSGRWDPRPLNGALNVLIWDTIKKLYFVKYKNCKGLIGSAWISSYIGFRLCFVMCLVSVSSIFNL